MEDDNTLINHNLKSNTFFKHDVVVITKKKPIIRIEKLFFMCLVFS